MGFERNKETIWKENMACIMPSRMEGQSLAMLEAMSFGRMIISTNVGDAERLIEHGETGFICDATVESVNKILDEAWNKRTDWLKIVKRSNDRLYTLITEDPVITFANILANN